MTEYRRCVRCIMDTTDPDIEFDTNGMCSWCQRWDRFSAALPLPEERQRRLEAKLEEIRHFGQGKPYDCIIGLSGGVDSTYVAWLVKQYGLRPLAVHMDGGWNSEIAVSNIEQIVRRLQIDLSTFVVNWEEMKDLQLAFLKAPVVNADIPQDHAFLAALLGEARRWGLRHIISGANYATEFVLPRVWRGHAANDLRYLISVHKRFGTTSLRHYPRYSLQSYSWFRLIRKGEVFQILDYVDYDKAQAKRIIAAQLGWRDYGGKHYESAFTKFHQGYYLPRKLGFDKRLAHLSNLVLSGVSDREDALDEIQNPPLGDTEARLLLDHVANKLGLSDVELERLISQPPRPDGEFDTNRRSPLVPVARVLGLYGRLEPWLGS